MSMMLIKVEMVLEKKDGRSWRGESGGGHGQCDWRAITPEAYAPRLPRMICLATQLAEMKPFYDDGHY